VLRREASMASTRIITTLKSPGARSTWNRQTPAQQFYSPEYVDVFA